MSGPRGFPPLPTAILEARGSRHPRRRGADAEPRPPIERPTCPAVLKGEARAEWNRQVPELLKLNVLARIDRAALACFCEAWGEFVAAVKRVAKEGMTVVDAKGTVRVNPAVKIKNEAAARILQFAAQFGFTPSARTRLKSEPPPTEADPMELLLRSSEN